MSKYANQRLIYIADNSRSKLLFIGQNLNEGALKLWIYLTEFENNTAIRLSPIEIEKTVGVKKQQYINAFKELVDKNYLIQISDCCYSFSSNPDELQNMTPIELNKNTITIEEFYETAEVNSHLPNAFIYGLLNTTTNEIIYIGKTEKPIEERINQHKVLSRQDKDTILYQYLRSCDWDYKIIYESHNLISSQELQEKEKYFIEYYKPICNQVGLISKYTIINANI